MVCIEIGISRRLQGSPTGEEVELLVDVDKSLRRGTFSGGERIAGKSNTSQKRLSADTIEHDMILS